VFKNCPAVTLMVSLPTPPITEELLMF
jgi:hypothetical protein